MSAGSQVAGQRSALQANTSELKSLAGANSARLLFDVPDHICFLNSANIGPRLGSVRAAEGRALRRWAEPWNLTAADWFADTERVRVLVANIFRASPDEVAIVPSVSYAMAIAAMNLPVAKGQNIVVLDEEFPSNFYAWDQHARSSGGSVRTVRRPPTQPWLNVILEAIDADTAIVSVPVCHWADGGLTGIETVASRARECGAALVVDASQSLGIIPFDVQALDPDFVVSVGYKWLLGPFGTSYLYVAPRHREGRAVEHAWPARKGSEDLSRLVEYQDKYRVGARRFDAGEHQNFILLPMAIAALEQMQAWRSGSALPWLKEVTHAVSAAGGTVGLDPVPQEWRAPHLVGLRAGNARANRVATELRSHDVYVAARGDSIRVAAHMHVTKADINRFEAALRACV